MKNNNAANNNNLWSSTKYLLLLLFFSAFFFLYRHFPNEQQWTKVDNFFRLPNSEECHIFPNVLSHFGPHEVSILWLIFLLRAVAGVQVESTEYGKCITCRLCQNTNLKIYVVNGWWYFIIIILFLLTNSYSIE